MNKILFVSIALPPKNDPECIQSGRYLYYLEKQNKWDFTTITSASPTLFMPYDESLVPYIDNIKNEVEIRIPENKYLNYIIRKVNKSLLNRPDSKMLFHWQWRKVIKKVAKPDLIYSRSFPLSSTIMAYKLKQHYGIPWIMHLSDPWVESPLLNHSKNRFNIAWEKRCFESADIVSFTNQSTLKLYSAKYPAHDTKFRVFPNVYDPADLQTKVGELQNNKQDRLKIVYTGGLANTRSAEVFIDALKILKNNENDLTQKLDIVFAGDMDAANKRLFEEQDLGFIKHLGLLSNSEAQSLQLESDILLIIDSRVEHSENNVFFPSKLLDYMTKRKFILGITEDKSPTYEFIKKINGVIFNFDQQDLLASWLGEVINDHQKIKKEKRIDEFYSAEYQAQNLSQLFKEVLKT